MTIRELPFAELAAVDSALLAYLLERSVVDGDCLIWLRSLSSTGYPHSNTGRWGKQFPHRILWLIVNGEIPAGRRLANACGSRRCIRPAHWVPRTPGAIISAQYDSGARAGERLYRAALRGHMARANTKGSFERAAEARRLLDGGRSIAQIAAELGISKPTARRWAYGKSWRPVSPFATLI